MEKLDELIGYLTDTLKGSSEFVKEQAPDVARQILTYAMWENGVYVGLALVVMLAAWLTIPRHLARWKAEYEKDRHNEFPLHCVGKGFLALTTVWGLIVTLSSILDMVKIQVAPKLYLLDYLAHIVRKGR